MKHNINDGFNDRKVLHGHSFSLNAYKEQLELEKYSNNTKKNWLYYATELDGCEITQESINNLIRNHNNKFARAFINNLLRIYNIKTISVPKISGYEKKEGIEYLEKSEIDILRKELSTKLSIMVGLMFEAGLRISELLDLKKSDINIIKRYVKGKGKGNQFFKQPFMKRTALDLEEYIKNFKDKDFIFRWDGVEAQRQRAYYVFKKAIKEILGKTVKSPNHIFRHSLGTHLDHKGVTTRKIQIILRHKNISTSEIYIDPDQDETKGIWKEAMKGN